MDQQQQARIEALGPAERIISTLIHFTDHMVHNRTGMVTPDPQSALGVRWQPVIWKQEGDDKIVYRTRKAGQQKQHERVGRLLADGSVVAPAGRTVGEYRKAGLFPESAAYLYGQVAEVWRLDNEFAARWASWSFVREHRDLKVVLCAFMLVQSRLGEPVIEDGEILFHDDDFRDVGEAMCLRRAKLDLNPKLLLRVGDVLNLDAVAAINRELGFGKSARNPFRGRYYRAVTKWLRHREENLPLLEGLVKAGFRSGVQKLARRVGYKPTSERFFEILRWKQAQASDGRRSIAVGEELAPAQSWEGLSEREICERIMAERPGWKRIVGLLPREVGMTRAIVAASVEAGTMSAQDLIIMTPTLEELGLLDVEAVGRRWQAAVGKAENQRAANIAKNVKSKEAKEGLQKAVDTATEKALKETTRNLRVYCIVDKSASMQGALERAQSYLTKFLGGFPLERLHVSVFNTIGTELEIKAPKAAAVKHAFRGHKAGGGTMYAEGVRAVRHHKPAADEDVLMIFVGDEEDASVDRLVTEIQESELAPAAFGLLKVVAPGWRSGDIVTRAAAMLGIPCFPIEEEMFESEDPYAVIRLLSHLIASTPVARAEGARRPLVQEILDTPLLNKPVWA